MIDFDRLYAQKELAKLQSDRTKALPLTIFDVPLIEYIIFVKF